MMWMNIFVLSMMFFVSSCRSFERKLICDEVTQYQVKETEVCIVSIRFNSCLCADKFDLNSWSTINDFRQEPLDYCDGIMGVQKEFALKEVEPKFVALQRLRESSCQKTKSHPQSKTLSTLTTTQKMSEVDVYYSHSSDSRNLTLKDEQ